jgi:hypothetical protein
MAFIERTAQAGKKLPESAPLFDAFSAYVKRYYVLFIVISIIKLATYDIDYYERDTNQKKRRRAVEFL